jgi:ABC-type multidrug transport system ATPase subunit
LNEKIRQLHEELEKLKDRIGLKESGNVIKSETIESIEEESPVNVIELKVEPEEKTQYEFFFTIPENDGSFKAINAKHAKEVESYYKIEMDNNNQTGKLHFISGEYDLRALDNIDYYLNPVCEIDNITERTHARKIIMLNPGTVLLSGDCWKIDVNNKVKIRLI